ncbi:MAG: hypothetical protein QXU40_01680 [Candidatus Pacearchaeota archaeon]
MSDKSKGVIILLVVVIVLLSLILVYTLFLRPAISTFIYNKQIEGYNAAYYEIIQVVSQCRSVPIPTRNGTIITLIALECLQQQPVQSPSETGQG